MAESSAGFHEDPEQLRPETRDRHRAVVSLIEELDAVDWYDQRIDATADAGLQDILRHNRDEEREHAAMLLEWLRRDDPIWDTMLRRYLFSERPIAEVAREELAELQADDGGSAGDASAAPAGSSLGIGRNAGKEML
jgi:uncharacterized protein